MTPATPSFSDVPPSNVFYSAIETAHAHGVINGYSDGTFRPNNNIRRDEMCQIVYKGVTTP
jgi:S-layer homology domain